MRNVIQTARLILRPFEESDCGDLFEFLSQLENDEFEGYPGFTRENGKKHLAERLGSDEYRAVTLIGSGKVIGNIYCGKRAFDAREVGFIINEKYRRRLGALPGRRTPGVRRMRLAQRRLVESA